MNGVGAFHPFTAILARDLRRQLLTGAQLVLFALMAVIVVLVVLAPKVVGSIGSSPPTVHAFAPSDVIAAVQELEPTWRILQSDVPPRVEGSDVGIVAAETTLEVRVERGSQSAVATVVGERFATAMLVAGSGEPAPLISYRHMIDDSDAVITRIITLMAALLTFSVVTGRAAWAFGALSHDVSLGLFDAVLARSPASSGVGGRVAAATLAGIAQLLALALIASAALLATSERDMAERVLQLALPLALWAGGGIALFVVAAMMLALLFRSSGAASLGIATQLLGFLAFGVLIFALLDPTAPWLGIAGRIPPISVILLPVQLAEGVATIADALIAASGVVLLIAVLFWLSLRAWRAATTTDGVADTWRAMLSGHDRRLPS